MNPTTRPRATASGPRHQRLYRLVLLLAGTVMVGGLALMACGGSAGGSAAIVGPDSTGGTATGTDPAAGSTTPPSGSATTTPGPPPKASILNSSLSQPWALAFLPDGRMLVTQKGGTMVLLSADGLTVSGALGGVPAVVVDAQGGLLDVALDPDFDLATQPWIYWTYAEAGSGGSGTAVARGKLVLNSSTVAAGQVPGQLTDVQVIYRQTPKVSSGGHYGSRLAFRADKTLFVTLGERQQDDPANPGTDNAQNLAKTLGKVVHLNRDGTPAAGNPYDGTTGLREIWSAGHRNPQGAAIHPVTGELWLTEHGPQGGDELNRVVAGKNYGWPIRSYGCPYGSPVGEACRVGGGTHTPTYVEPVSYWVPTSVAPAGLIFYTGTRFPEWTHHAFTGALSGQALWRIALDGNGVETAREKLSLVNERVRDVRQGLDGWIYLLTDSGQLIRIER